MDVSLLPENIVQISNGMAANSIQNRPLKYWDDTYQNYVECIFFLQNRMVFLAIVFIFIFLMAQIKHEDRADSIITAAV